MTEDWRKALGLDNVAEDEVVEYNGELYVNGERADKLSKNLKINKNVSDENFFIHEFLIFAKSISSYRIKRKLNDYELDALSAKDQKKYLELYDDLDEMFQQYLRYESKELLDELNKKFNDLLLIIIKFLKSKKLVKFDAKKIASKYSKVPFIGKIENNSSGSQSNYSSVLKYEFLKKNEGTKEKKQKTIIQNTKHKNDSDTKNTNSDSSLVNKIKRLKELYKKGTLDKTEFEQAKNKLLK